MVLRWLPADQLGPHFLDDTEQRVLVIEAKGDFRGRRVHRQKAHLILSALRHRAAELGDRAVQLRVDTVPEAFERLREPVEVCHPTSRQALEFARTAGLTVLPARGFVTDHRDFVAWADSRRGALRVADFYRFARERHRVLLAGPAAAGAAATARGVVARRGSGSPVPPPPAPVEDEIDAEVRRELDRWAAEGIRFVGRDGPRRYPVTAAEAEARLAHFLTHRLPAYASLRRSVRSGDPYLAHSVLSPAFNLGLLDPLPVIRRVEQAGRAGGAPPAAVETFVRQLLGWRDFLWHLYWYFDPGFRSGNWLAAQEPVPDWFADLDADAVEAACLADALAGVRDGGWAHQEQRLMVLGNYALQRGWRPAELVSWFRDSFVDGSDWVMNATVIGLSQYADLGRIATDAYAADGSYLDRVSDHCGGCRYDPRRGLGDDACPFTGGFTSFLHRNQNRLRDNPRMLAAVRRLGSEDDLPGVLAQEEKRGSNPP
ncbi:cryptochrome/photolyase family protein [Plantactinospora siamensis]|uniref:Cryptochrome/photolyase family protein n=1 Tax=Plantactinospora siamensis TaxID=555372 RepID=A0ABV6NRJ9_9ACTN